MIYQAGLLLNNSSCTYDDEIGNAHDIESLRQSWAALCVDFQNNGSARHLRRSALNFRRRLPARPTPGCPEIDQYRNPRPGDDFIKGFQIDIERL